VFIAGTEPFPLVQEEPMDIALGPQSQPETTLGGKGSPLRADEIVLTSDTQEHEGNINARALLSTGLSHGSLPLGPTQPSTP
jgi:hypothetical protein